MPVVQRFCFVSQELSLRRWSSVQARDFGALHATLATLILNSDVSPHRTECKFPIKIKVSNMYIQMAVNLSHALKSFVI